MCHDKWQAPFSAIAICAKDCIPRLNVAVAVAGYCRYGSPRQVTDYLLVMGAQADPDSPNKGNDTTPITDALRELSEIRNGTKDGKALACTEGDHWYKVEAEKRAEAEAAAAYARKFPLHVAVADNNLPVIRSLIESGKARPDDKDDKGLTPLQVGMQCRNWRHCFPRIKGRVAQYLLSKGANARQDMGDAYPPGYSLLHRASGFYMTVLVEALIKAGADPNAARLDKKDNKTLLTPLMEAAECPFGLPNYDTDTFKALLDAGAQPYVPNTRQPITELFYDGGVVDNETLKRCNVVGGQCSEEEVAKLAQQFDRCGGGWELVWRALNRPQQPAGGSGPANSSSSSGASTTGRKLLLL